MKQYDFLIIGAGPAGIFSAALLTRKGYRVCVLEKRQKNECKVCGDGISVRAVETLRSVGFPVSRIPDAGGVKISRIIRREDGKTTETALDRRYHCAFALRRGTTDALLREYCGTMEFPVFYGTGVSAIRSRGGLFHADGFCAEQLVIACGANAAITVDGERVFSYSDRPIGVSAVIKGAPCADTYYLFDCRPEYHGTYAWIFTLGDGQYNVGLWLRQERHRIRGLFTRFCETTVREYCGEWSVVTPMRGAFMGIGEKPAYARKGVYLIGDAAATACETDGEGISRAIHSALDFARRIPDKEDTPC